MPDYCIYIVGPRRRILTAPQVTHLRDDNEAFMRATQLATETGAAEVWVGRRLVCHVPARAAGAPEPGQAQSRWERRN